MKSFCFFFELRLIILIYVGNIISFLYFCGKIKRNIIMKHTFAVVIPARYASTRFPGKPLAVLAGKTIIQRVYEQARKVLPDVCVATDDERIFRHVESFGGCAIMTSPNHRSGTDRINEAVSTLDRRFDVIINLQGDEPFVRESHIQTLCACFDDDRTQIATLGIPFTTMEEVENPNSPKIVTDKDGFALYFSRSVIPYVRGVERAEWLDHFPYLRHMGIYAYRRDVLSAISQLPPSPLEVAESLEQLRWLQHGFKIRVAKTEFSTIGIDTPEDLEKAKELLLTSPTPL